MGAVLSPRNRSPLRILLLDQSQGSHARLALLKDSGHPITLANCLAEAIGCLGSGGIDIVVADHPSPSGDAMQLIRQIRAAGPTVGVILISAYVDSLGLNEANTGADIVIQKSAHEVAHLVRSVARLQRRKPVRKPATSIATSPKAKAKTI